MTKPLIELVYFPGCPHVEAARAALRTALQELGLPVQWHSWAVPRPGLGHSSGAGGMEILSATLAVAQAASAGAQATWRIRSRLRRSRRRDRKSRSRRFHAQPKVENPA